MKISDRGFFDIWNRMALSVFQEKNQNGVKRENIGGAIEVGRTVQRSALAHVNTHIGGNSNGNY